jgi:hypothetical protein
LAKTWVDQIVDRLASEIAMRVNEVAARSAPAGRSAGARPRRKLDMRCRVAGCRNRSRGPRFGFICDEHRKTLSKKAQQEARDKWKARKAA